MEVATPQDFQVRNIAGIEDPLLEAVIALGDANRKTLGFLPRAGYFEAAARESIIVAVSLGAVVGYCLYDRSRQFVRIVHLCVSPAHRGKGITRLLVGRVEDADPTASGIRLKCRRDWPAAGLWPTLGFRPMNEVPGRSRARHPLTIWWKPLATTEDLLTVLEDLDDEPMTVSLDSNVFSDLHCDDDADRRRLAAPVALMSGDQQIRLVLPHCAVDEINQIADPRRRKRLLNAQHGYRVLDHGAAAQQVHKSLVSGLEASVVAEDPSLPKDAWLVAESVAARCDVFITRDENAIRQLGPAAVDIHGLAMMLPSELPDHRRRRLASGDYRPANLAETGVTRMRDVSTHWSVTDLDELLNRDAGERKVALRERLRVIAEESGKGRTARFLAVAPGGRVLAAWAYSVPSTDRDPIEIPLLRVIAGSSARTLARQILFSVRSAAADGGVRQIVLGDPTPSADAVHVLPAEGFTQRPSSTGTNAAWICSVVDQVGSWRTVATWADLNGQGLPLEGGHLSAEQAAELERRCWPLKITDSGLPNYLIPIRGAFADELLGHAPTLIPRDTALGLSRENVYYRAPSGQPKAPGRILWYSSGRDFQVVACSSLIEALAGEPDVVHREFKRLGVWSREQVRAAARGGRVGAIRFADTEVLPHPVDLNWMRGLSPEAARLPSQGPRSVSAELFTAIYTKGRWG